ncbi:MAG: Cna B-type domain-containing protein [Coriobacteriales bacterium]|jgi:hypothetical protein
MQLTRRTAREVVAGIAVTVALAVGIATGTVASAQEGAAGQAAGSQVAATSAEASAGTSAGSGIDAGGATAQAADDAEQAQGTTGDTRDASAQASAGSGSDADAGATSTDASASDEATSAAADDTDAPADAEQAQGTSQADESATAPSPLASPALFAAARGGGSGAQVDVEVTELKIQSVSHEDVSDVFITSTFSLKMRWDASAMGNNLHEGDYFDVTIPDEMVFVSDSPQSDFNLTDDDGNVVATAHVTTGADGSGGTIHVTFTDYVEGKYNVKGTMYLGARFDTTKVTEGDGKTFSFAVNGEVTPGSTTPPITIVGPSDLDDEYLTKWGERVTGSPDKVKWVARVNWVQANLDNLTITDSLSSDESMDGIQYDPDGFVLTKVIFDSKGNVTSKLGDVDLTDKLQISADGKSFTLNLGDIASDGSQYRLVYTSSYRPGMTLKNRVEMNATGVTKTSSSTYKSAESGGTGGGDLANKIKIVKVDAADHQTPLAGATFLVTGPDGSSFELTTGADGTVTSGYLVQGSYTVVETTAPIGYDPSGQTYTLEVTSSGGAVLTVEDTRQTVSVPVTKEWSDNEDQDGLRPTSVTVSLLANGQATGQTLTLTADNGWTGSFDALPRYDDTGSEIAYTVEEADVPEGYTAQVSEDSQNGYVVVNMHTPETVSVPVTKTWVGPEAGPVTVHLLADGADTGKTLTLTADDDWKGTFEGLAKYRDHGVEIAYTVSEDAVPGYDAAVTGSAQDGFAITNTATGTTAVSGTKTWDDANDQDGMRPDSITVNLLADGERVDSVTVGAAQGWAYEFAGLPVYDAADGHQIAYTVEEASVPEGYEATVSGTDIVNTHVPGTTSVSASKAWDDADDQDGLRPASVSLQLLANGEPYGEPVTLGAINGWKATWSGLPQRQGGDEVTYTVEEVDVPEGYEATVSGDAQAGFVVTNSHTPETTSVAVTKTWVGTTGGPVTIHLLADGADTGKTLTLSSATGWKATFEGLAKYRDHGTSIAYTVSEDAVSGYTASVSGDATAGFTVTNTSTEVPPTPPSETPKTPTPSNPGTPTPQGQSVPKTGDQTDALALGIVAAAGVCAVVAGVIGVVVARRRRTRD